MLGFTCGSVVWYDCGMKTVFTMSGYDLHGTSTDKLVLLNNGLKNRGYNVVPVSIPWIGRTHTKYIKEFVNFYNQHKAEENIVVGNSFGAAVALMSAPEIKPSKLYLCSLSPFFEEDRGIYTDEYAISIFGKRRAQDFWSYSADTLAAQVTHHKISTVVVYGEKERQTSPALVSRCKQTARAIHGAELIEIPDCPHNMSDTIYSTAMIEIIR